MKILEQKIKMRKRREFWLKIACVLLFAALVHGVLNIVYTRHVLRVSEATSEIRTEVQVSPPQSNSLFND